MTIAARPVCIQTFTSSVLIEAKLRGKAPATNRSRNSVMALTIGASLATTRISGVMNSPSQARAMSMTLG